MPLIRTANTLNSFLYHWGILCRGRCCLAWAWFVDMTCEVAVKLSADTCSAHCVSQRSRHIHKPGPTTKTYPSKSSPWHLAASPVLHKAHNYDPVPTDHVPDVRGESWDSVSDKLFKPTPLRGEERVLDQIVSDQRTPLFHTNTPGSETASFADLYLRRFQGYGDCSKYTIQATSVVHPFVCQIHPQEVQGPGASSLRALFSPRTQAQVHGTIHGHFRFVCSSRPWLLQFMHPNNALA